MGLWQPHQDDGLCHTNNEQGLAPKNCLQQQTKALVPHTCNATASSADLRAARALLWKQEVSCTEDAQTVVCLDDAAEPCRRQDLHSREDAICSQAVTVRKLATPSKLQ